MQFKYHIGTKVFFGKGCVKENRTELTKFGKRAVIITGKYSGKSSGALDDVADLFNESGIEYLIYDKIENNPSLENVKDGGRTASGFKADFVVGIGGGSPLDAAKAAAVLAVNDIEPVELYKNSFAGAPLPIIAIATTAGTGSEVTPYSILTRGDMRTKMSFGNDDTFPRVSFLDARYTESLPIDVTVNTAVDALSHAIEGYLGKRSMPVSDIFAMEAIRIFGECFENLAGNNIDFNVREKLLYMSMLGGMVVSHAGTTLMHGMGYSLTYFKGIPHGKANGLLMGEYLKFNYDAVKYKTENILRLLNMGSADEFGAAVGGLFHNDASFSDDEFNMYASITMKQKSTSFNARNVSEGDILKILNKSLRRK